MQVTAAWEVVVAAQSSRGSPENTFTVQVGPRRGAMTRDTSRPHGGQARMRATLGSCTRSDQTLVTTITYSDFETVKDRFYTYGPDSSHALSRLSTRSQRRVHQTDQLYNLTIVRRPSVRDYAILSSTAAALACMGHRGCEIWGLASLSSCRLARRSPHRLQQQGHNSRSNRPTINDPARFAVTERSFARADWISTHPRSPMGTCSHLGFTRWPSCPTAHAA